jgi:hypothetical protein
MAVDALRVYIIQNDRSGIATGLITVPYRAFSVLAFLWVSCYRPALILDLGCAASCGCSMCADIRLRILTYDTLGCGFCFVKATEKSHMYNDAAESTSTVL